MVVELDVRDDRDVRGKLEDGPVRLVTLDHEPAGARARVAAELRDLAPDQERRDRRRANRGSTRSSLPWSSSRGRPRRRSTAGGATSSARKLRAAAPRDPPGVRGRDDRLGAGRRRRRIRRHVDRDPGGPDVGQVRRLVPIPAGHLGAPGPRRPRRSRTARRRRCRRTTGGGRQASGKRHQLLRDDVGGVGLREREHRRSHRREPLRVAEKLGHLATEVELRFGNDHRASAAARSTGRSSPGGRQSRTGTGRAARASRRPRPPTPSRPRARRPGRQRRARSELVGEGQQPVVGRGAAAARARGSRARPARWSTAGPLSAKASYAASFRRAAPWLPPKTSTTGPSAGSPNSCSRLGRLGRAGARGDRAADDAVLRPVDGRRAESARNTAPRERRGEAVREPEVGVRLGQRRRDPERPGGERPSARPRSLPLRGRRRAGGDGGSAGTRQGAVTSRASARTRSQARTAREALDPEGVELEAGAGREPLLDRVRPTGERDVRAAALQRLGDCERRQDVPGGSARGDQEPWRLASAAAWLTAMLRRMPTEASRTTRLEPP